ncbi:MAG TPA: alternative ribosome rescue aminoacyl-tRNA hydrolase ArfB [Phycisphaerales bacterium]|nr:alternative ribosome rescue aminoacyl-tRNA hydrolase ArfB [Phycisphaerales bacterium]
MTDRPPHDDAGNERAETANLVRLAPGVAVRPEALRFTFVSSSGPGGQNVNKRATRAVLRVRLDDLPLPPGARSRLRRLASRHLAREKGELVIAADEYRSQSRNRAACLERLADLVERSLHAPKPRRATKPTKGSVERRIAAKKRRGETKRGRGGIGD